MHRIPIGAIALALAAARVPAQDAAFLLGRGETTTLIVVRGDSVSVRHGEGLVVPRASGWWRVGVSMAPHDSLRRLREEAEAAADTAAAAADSEPTNKYGEPVGREACFGHAIWTARLGARPVLPDTICGEGEQLGGHWTFTFLGPTLATLYTTITGDYTYNFQAGMVAAPLDSLAREPVTTLDAGGDWLEHTLRDPRWRAEARRCNRGYNRVTERTWDDDDSTGFGYAGTVVTREPGRWRLSRYYLGTNEASRGFDWSCSLAIAVPASITGWDRLTVPMPTVKRRVPGAWDAFSSPQIAGKGIAIVLAGRDAHVFRTRGATLGAELGVVALPDAAATQDVALTTMSQWAVGAAARRWEQTLAPVLVEPVPVRSR